MSELDPGLKRLLNWSRAAEVPAAEEAPLGLPGQVLAYARRAEPIDGLDRPVHGLVGVHAGGRQQQQYGQADLPGSHGQFLRGDRDLVVRSPINGRVSEPRRGGSQ